MVQGSQAEPRGRAQRLEPCWNVSSVPALPHAPMNGVVDDTHGPRLYPSLSTLSTVSLCSAPQPESRLSCTTCLRQSDVSRCNASNGVTSVCKDCTCLLRTLASAFRTAHTSLPEDESHGAEPGHSGRPSLGTRREPKVSSFTLSLPPPPSSRPLFYLDVLNLERRSGKKGGDLLY